jgi:hypothetical protein
MGIESSPALCRSFQSNDMNKDIRRERIEQPAKHLLVASNPRGILEVLNRHLLFVDVLSLQLLDGCILRSFHEIEDTSATQCRDHKGLPHQGIVTG